MAELAGHYGTTEELPAAGRRRRSSASDGAATLAKIPVSASQPAPLRIAEGAMVAGVAENPPRRRADECQPDGRWRAGNDDTSWAMATGAHRNPMAATRHLALPARRRRVAMVMDVGARYRTAWNGTGDETRPRPLPAVQPRAVVAPPPQRRTRATPSEAIGPRQCARRMKTSIQTEARWTLIRSCPPRYDR